MPDFRPINVCHNLNGKTKCVICENGKKEGLSWLYSASFELYLANNGLITNGKPCSKCVSGMDWKISTFGIVQVQHH